MESAFAINRAARPWRMAAAVVLLCAVVSGCALPRSGPSAAEFDRAAAREEIDLAVPTGQDVLASREPGAPGFDPAWQVAPAFADARIGPGDVLKVTVFERDGLGMFPAGADGAAVLDGIVVDPSGTIQFPYVGSMAVGGMTPAEVRQRLLVRLRKFVVSPDLLVSVSERQSGTVSVQGDVARPGMVPLTPGTNRLLTLLGAAAPTPANLEQAVVTVRRGGASASVPLSAIYERPEENIALRPGDAVIVRNVVASVNVLGAAGLQGRVRISKANYTLLDAIGDARGLNDAAASPGAVYLMRLGNGAALAGARPRVYLFDFRDPGQIALASAFRLHDGDAVLIANAPFAQAHKVLSAFSGVLNTARSAAVVVP